MVLRKSHLPMCFAGYLLLVVAAPAAQAETLEAMVQAALVNHPGVEAMQAQSKAAHEEESAETSGYYPKISVSGTAGRMYADNSTSRGLSVTRGAGYSGLGEGTATASQMLFDGFETKSRVSAAAAKSRSVEMDVLDVRESLALRAAQAYLNVLRTRAALSMLHVHEKKVADYLERIKVSVDEGVSDESEYQQARDVKVILDGYITDYEGQARIAEADYFEVTGGFPDADMALPTPNISEIPESMAQAVAYARDNHPAMKSALYSSRSKQDDIMAARADLYPDIKGELSYMKSDKADLIGGEAEDRRAVLRLNWALETGGAQISKIRQKKYQHQEALSKLNDTQRQLENRVRLAYAELQTAQAQRQNQKNRLDLNGKLFETYKVQFEGARINLLQLMQADNQLFSTQLEKLNGEYRILASQYNVLASIGRLQSSLMVASSGATSVAHEQN